MFCYVILYCINTIIDNNITDNNDNDNNDNNNTNNIICFTITQHADSRFGAEAISVPGGQVTVARSHEPAAVEPGRPGHMYDCMCICTYR